MIKKIKPLIEEYLVTAFYAVNKEIKLYLIAVFFICLDFLITSLKFSPLSLLVSLFSWAYTLSLPVFFQSLSENKKTENSFIFRKTMENSKRLIIPGIIIFVFGGFLLMLAFFVVLISLGVHSKISPAEMQQYLNLFLVKLGNIRQQPLWYIIWLPLGFFWSLFYFQSVYFAIEQKGFFRSFIYSFKYAVKNLYFVLTIFLFMFLVGLISLILYPFPTSFAIFQDLHYRIITTLISLFGKYISLIQIAAVTFYYLHNNQNKTT